MPRVPGFAEARERWFDTLEAEIGRACEGHGLLSRMAAYHLGTGGKRLRALLPVWVAGNLGGVPEEAVGFGTGLELLHNGTLVHDDIQDGDRFRRGEPTVWSRWGINHAIDVANFLYFRGFACIGAAPAGRRGSEVAGSALARVVEGQTMEFQLGPGAPDEERLPRSIESWERMVRGKTGALFGACFECGYLAAGRPDDELAAAREFGATVGVLFQLHDDLLDLVGDKGREQRGSDLGEGKTSWPVAWSLASADAAAVDELEEILAAPRDKTTAAMIARGIELLDSAGALDAASRRIRELAGQLGASPAAATVPGFVEKILAPVAQRLD